MTKRSLITAFVLIASLAAPTAAFAGWGAIACDSAGSGACSASWGWGDQASAENTAMSYCYSSGYANCYIDMWEHNECIYGPNGSYACN